VRRSRLRDLRGSPESVPRTYAPAESESDETESDESESAGGEPNSAAIARAVSVSGPGGGTKTALR